jgi:hypothetical protein
LIGRFGELRGCPVLKAYTGCTGYVGFPFLSRNYVDKAPEQCQHFSQRGHNIVKACMCMLVVLPCFSASVSAGVPARVVFQNGDRVSGELLSADANGVQFQPSETVFGGLVVARWTADHIAEIRLESTPDGTPVCMFASRSDTGGTVSRKVCFQSAVATRALSGGSVRLRLTKFRDESGASVSDPTGPRSLIDVASLSVAQPGNPNLAGRALSDGPIESAQHSPASAPPAASNNAASPALSMWSLGLSAPESIVQGTQSSQTLGGLFSDDLYFGDSDHFSLTASGTHQHNLSLHKPSIRTDTFDGTAMLSHAVDAFKIYAVGDWFLNTSLGMAAQRSGGGGVLFPVYRPSKRFSAELWADLRYFNERLYSSKDLDLVGSRIHTQAHYVSADGAWSLTAEANYVPMFNNTSAWQSYGRFMVSFPVGNHVCLDLTPADDYYFDNSPLGFRRNYLKSTATLRIQAGSNPADKCKQ